MNGFMSREKVDYYKEKYPAGTRIQLDSMNDKYAIPPGSKGTVTYTITTKSNRRICANDRKCYTGVGIIRHLSFYLLT